MGGRVTVVGTATVPARPDRAEVELTVTHLAPTPAEAIARVIEQMDVLAALLAELGLTEADWVTGGINVGEETRWADNRQEVVGHRAATRVVARLRDPNAVGRLVTEAVTRASARVQGPTWLVDPTSPARAEAHRLAALDARRTAEAYAGALDLALGDVRRIRDPRPDGPVPRAMFATMAASPGQELQVSPGEVTVSAAVEVTFALRRQDRDEGPTVR